KHAGGVAFELPPFVLGILAQALDHVGYVALDASLFRLFRLLERLQALDFCRREGLLVFELSETMRHTVALVGRESEGLLEFREERLLLVRSDQLGGVEE